MASRVGERGQITVEKRVREQLTVYPGDQAVQWVEDGRLIVQFVPAPHRRSLAGALKDKVTRRPASEEWTALRDAAWATPDPDRAAGEGIAVEPTPDAKPAPTTPSGSGRSRTRPAG